MNNCFLTQVWLCFICLRNIMANNTSFHYNSLSYVKFRVHVITLENDDCSFDKYYIKNECLRYPSCFLVFTIPFPLE